jgi:O-antigen/teichoic acid export membrane protein
MLTTVLSEELAPMTDVFGWLLCSFAAHAFVVVYGLQVMAVKGRGWALNATLLASVALGVGLAFAWRGEYGAEGIAAEMLCARLAAAMLFLGIVIVKDDVDRAPLAEIAGTLAPALLMMAVLSATGVRHWRAVAFGVIAYGIFFIAANPKKSARLVNALATRSRSRRQAATP